MQRTGSLYMLCISNIWKSDVFSGRKYVLKYREIRTLMIHVIVLSKKLHFTTFSWLNFDVKLLFSSFACESSWQPADSQAESLQQAAGKTGQVSLAWWVNRNQESTLPVTVGLSTSFFSVSFSVPFVRFTWLVCHCCLLGVFSLCLALQYNT